MHYVFGCFQNATRGLMTNKGGGTAWGGAGGGDAYTVAIMEQRKQEASMRDCRVTGPIRITLPAMSPPPPEVVVDGIYVPDAPLTTTADLTYVLNQAGLLCCVRVCMCAIQYTTFQTVALRSYAHC